MTVRMWETTDKRRRAGTTDKHSFFFRRPQPSVSPPIVEDNRFESQIADIMTKDNRFEGQGQGGG